MAGVCGNESSAEYNYTILWSWVLLWVVACGLLKSFSTFLFYFYLKKPYTARNKLVVIKSIRFEEHWYYNCQLKPNIVFASMKEGAEFYC